MAERGIDLLGEGARPEELEEAAVRASDVVITMGCGDECPFFPACRIATGSSRIRPVEESRPSGRFATRLNGVCWSWSPNS
jgi:protein-tyrosine-phosphatase